MELATADEVMQIAARAVRSPPRLTVSEWADRERRLSPEASPESGRWRTSRAEYQRGIMDAVSDRANREVIVMSSVQVGKTEILNNIVGFFIAQDPSPILLFQPTLEMGHTWSKDRLAPMVRDTPVLAALVAESNSKTSGNTITHKQFPGGTITIAGANSPASLASRPIRVVLLDEVDRYIPTREGDPVALATARTRNFWNRRIVMTSTPTIKGSSRIEQAFENSDQRRYHVPCPHCQTFQVLKWSAVIWTESKPETARIACESCGALLDDADRIGMIAKGEWQATAPFNGTAGFHLWEVYSPWRTLADIVGEFLRAKPYRETLKAWVNTTLGESWEDRDGEKIAGGTLASLAEDYKQWEVPAGALLLTAGVDVQHDRLALAIWGFGPGEEAWAIAWEEIYGSPAESSTWNKLDETLARRLPHELGGDVGITAYCVDAGDGVTTGYVLDYCRSRRTALAIKGQSQPGKPPIGKPATVDINLRGKTLKRSAKLWPVGSDTIKGWLMGRIKQTGMVHFPADLPDDFFDQITSERLVTKFYHGMPKRIWVKADSARNEALDATVYAYAAAVWAGLKRANWLVLKRRAEMPRKEAETSTEPALSDAAPQKSTIRNARPRGFVKGWK